jgi:hypothetical protein
MKHWIDSVQATAGRFGSSYKADDWSYLTEEHNFVDGGLHSDAFININAVSGIVNRGSYNSNFPSSDFNSGPERVQNVHKVLAALQTSLGAPVETPQPEDAPVFSPATPALVIAPVSLPVPLPGVPWTGHVL